MLVSHDSMRLAYNRSKEVEMAEGLGIEMPYGQTFDWGYVLRSFDIYNGVISKAKLSAWLSKWVKADHGVSLENLWDSAKDYRMTKSRMPIRQDRTKVDKHGGFAQWLEFDIEEVSE